LVWSLTDWFDLQTMHLDSAEIKEVYRKALEAWQERKDTCVSEIYSAVEDNADAQEIADQYMLEKEILPANHANKETMASELLTRLINRFRGELEDEVSKLSSQFTQFVITIHGILDPWYQYNCCDHFIFKPISCFLLWCLFNSHGPAFNVINALSSLLAFAHTQDEAGTPTEGIWNALVGRKSPVRGAFFRVK
jgi:hypothetical protein